MSKPIIATTLSGLFVKSSPWENAHILWFENMAEKLGDNTIKEWADKPNYFEGVDIVMKRLYPALSDKERTKKARELFFDAVCEYIEKNPQVRNLEIIEYFESLRDKYQIALITTNTRETVDKILSIIGLSDFFDIIETSLPEEKDNKSIVFERFISKNGKPIIYIGGGRKDSYDYCQAQGIQRIFANLESEEEIAGVKSVHSLEELKEVIARFGMFLAMLLLPCKAF